VAGEKPGEPKSQGQARWLEAQQLELFDVLKEKELMQKAYGKTGKIRKNRKRCTKYTLKKSARDRCP
jgi:hypothetical protein